MVEESREKGVPSRVKIVDIDNTIEEKILTGMIVSDKFLTDVSAMAKQDFFQVRYVKVVSGWCLEYFNKYKEAPKNHIKDIFITKRDELKQDESNIIESFLTNLSRKYEKNEEQFNPDYLLDHAVKYFKKKGIEHINQRVQAFLNVGKVDQAEREISNYKQVGKLVTQWVNPLSSQHINSVFQAEERGDYQLFKFPGQLGELIGWFERGTLLGFLGAYKRGKTFWLTETAIQGLLNKYKVALISLEMDAYRMARRIYKRLTAFGSDDTEFIYPTFDCLRNQNGSCTSSKRTNRAILLNAEGEPPPYSRDLRYRPCVACRGTRQFIATSWFTTIFREKMRLGNTRKKIKAITNMYGNNFRLITHPSYSANVSDIKRDLENLEYTEDFVPDIIIVDYADILAPEDARLTGRDRLDETWKMLKNVADEKHCMTVSASQSTRKGAEKVTLTQSDTAEDIRKIAHGNYWIALNQTPQEKRKGIMRIGLIAAREEDFDQYKHVMVLQQLKLGQPNLDSEMIYKQDTDIIWEE